MFMSRPAGRAIDERLARPVPFVTEDIQREVALLVRRRLAFDAVFAASDLMAMTLVSALRTDGVRVPEQVRVVGYDDIALAEHFHPSLPDGTRALTLGRGSGE